MLCASVSTPSWFIPIVSLYDSHFTNCLGCDFSAFTITRFRPMFSPRVQVSTGLAKFPTFRYHDVGSLHKVQGTICHLFCVTLVAYRYAILHEKLQNVAFGTVSVTIAAAQRDVSGIWCRLNMSGLFSFFWNLRYHLDCMPLRFRVPFLESL